MHSPSLICAWAFWQHQGGRFLAMLGYAALAALLSAVLPPYFEPGMADFVIGVLAMTAAAAMPIYLLIFTYGLEGADVIARESLFPPYLFRLPVPTRALVVGPMIAGGLLTVLLWAFTAGLILQPWMARLEADHVPLWWPGFLLAAALAWIQALSWSPFGMRGLRLAALSALIVSLLPIVGLSNYAGIAEVWLVGVYTTFMLLGWLVGYIGVQQGRCGNVPNWEAILQPLWHLVGRWPQRRSPFASPACAQVWFEWRLSGWSLPFFTFNLLIVSLTPLYLGPNDIISTAHTLLAALLIPVILGSLFGAQGGGFNPGVKGRIGLGPFSATLPMSTADMVAAMLKSAALATLIAWAIMLVMISFVVVVTGHWPKVAGWWRQAIDQYHPAQIVAILGAGGTLLVVWTWKRQVDRLYFGLTGRRWGANTVAMVCVPASGFLCVLAGWILQHPETHDAVLAVLPAILGATIIVRLLIAAWALRQVIRRGLVQPSTAARWLIAWFLLASLLFALLAWSVPTERVPVYYLAFAVVFAMPMARLAASPLVLAWNRHR